MALLAMLLSGDIILSTLGSLREAGCCGTERCWSATLCPLLGGDGAELGSLAAGGPVQGRRASGWAAGGQWWWSFGAVEGWVVLSKATIAFLAMLYRVCAEYISPLTQLPGVSVVACFTCQM